MALDLSVDQAETLKGRSGVTLFEDPSAYTVYMGLNTSAAPWDNAKTREAVKFCLSRGPAYAHPRRVYFIDAAQLGSTARAVKAGRSLAVADIAVVDERGTLVAIDRGVFKA